MDVDKNGFFSSCILLYYEEVNNNFSDNTYIWDSVCLSTDILYSHEFVPFLAERIKIRQRLLSIKVKILIILCLHHLNSSTFCNYRSSSDRVPVFRFHVWMKEFWYTSIFAALSR